MILDRRHVLSHRLRGFGFPEGSLEALREAARSGVLLIEVDTRATADGELLIHHAAHLGSIAVGSGPVSALTTRGEGTPLFLGTRIHVPRLDEFAEAFAGFERTLRLFLDIKDIGFEAEHLSILARHRLLDRTTIVSWWPEVLIRVHELNPDIPLSFSHISLAARSSVLRQCAHLLSSGISTVLPRIASRIESFRQQGELDIVFGEENRRIDGSVVGKIPAYVLSSLPAGALGAAITRSRGSIGVPSGLLSKTLVTRCHDEGFELVVFTLNEARSITTAVRDLGVDVVFTDRGELFRASGLSPA